jgi:capsular exopolysaccharide synthesis family protein
MTGRRVLLCDADLRKPSIHKLFNIPAKPGQGLPLLMSGQGREAGMIVKGPVPNLWLLPCGVRVPNPSELMGSERLGATLKRLRSRYDYLVFDSAPVLPVTDSVLLAPHLDGVVLVARFESSRLREISTALAHLRAAKANVFGLVLNAVDMQRYAYGYGYGRNHYKYYGDKHQA